MFALPPGPAWLFCPADRPDRYAKAQSAADAVILDLEDAVGTAAKSSAREHLISTTSGVLDLRRVIVRINPSGTPWFEDDLAAVLELRPAAVLVPKVESAAQMEVVADRTRVAGIVAVALCESVPGVRQADEVAAVRGCGGLMWGSEDLTADLGGLSGRDTSGRWMPAMEFARNHVRFAAAAAGRAAIDSPNVMLDEVDHLRREAGEAAGAGFYAKACIHPWQVEPVRSAFRPSAQSRAWAESVLTAVADRAGSADMPPAFALAGRMIDAPLVRLARTIAARSAP